jgi:hypothetical protein
MKFSKSDFEPVLLSRFPENQVGESVYLPSPSYGSAEMKTGTRLATKRATA